MLLSMVTDCNGGGCGGVSFGGGGAAAIVVVITSAFSIMVAGIVFAGLISAN